MDFGYNIYGIVLQGQLYFYMGKITLGCGAGNHSVHFLFILSRLNWSRKRRVEDILQVSLHLRNFWIAHRSLNLS